jgi:hypothetical protein
MIKIVKFCEKQLRDINPDDLIGGYVRKCNIARAMNGIDKFGTIYEKRYGVRPSDIHYITQTYGCNKTCEYCYVTQDGIWKDFVKVGPQYIFDQVREKSCPNNTVFHLMGGAPAFWIKYWPAVDLAVKFKTEDAGKTIFHSDFLLDEFLYEGFEEYFDAVKQIRRQLHAVSFKNSKPTELQMINLNFLIDKNIPFYITHTGDKKDFEVLRDSFRHHIPDDLVDEMYNIPIYWKFGALNEKENED